MNQKQGKQHNKKARYYEQQFIRTQKNKTRRARKVSHMKEMWADTWAFCRETMGQAWTHPFKLSNKARQVWRKARKAAWNTAHTKSEIEGHTLTSKPSSLAEFSQAGGVLHGGAAHA